MKGLTEHRPVHLFVFALLFVINHFFVIVLDPTASEPGGILEWLFNFMVAISVCSILPIGVYILLHFVYSKTKSAIISSLLFLPFFFFQDIFLSLEGFFFLGLRARWVLPTLLLGLILTIIFVIRSNRKLIVLNQYLNSVSIALTIYVTILMTVSFNEKKPRYLTYSPQFADVTCKECPDIYFFLLDAYTSNKSLRDYFNYDNRGFVSQLESRSFSVLDQAFSSQRLTEYSLAAYFNFNRIDDIKAYNAGIENAIEHNSVTQSLEKAGYRINAYSIFQVGEHPPSYSIIPTFPIRVVNRIIQSSVLNMVFDFVLKLNLYSINDTMFNEMIKTASKPRNGPNFFYYHVFAPHPPFVMDDMGKEIDFFKQSRSSNNPAAYVEQVKGLNKRILEVIEKINVASPEAIIVIAGDHGYRYLKSTPSDNESYTVFLAYHGPHQTEIGSLPFANDIFRLILQGLNDKY